MDNNKIPTNLIWLLLNIILPISPLLVKLFIVYSGNANLSSKISILELPEAFFFSISAAAVTISISVDRDKKLVDYLIVLFSGAIIVFDLLALGMVYSSNSGDGLILYSKLAFGMPTIIAIAYKFIYKSTDKREI